MIAFLAVVFFVQCASASDGVTPKNNKILVFSTFPSDGMGEIFRRVLTEAYARIGYEVAVKGFPAERALGMSNRGVVDGEAGRVCVIEEKCSNLIRVPTPIYTNSVVAFTKDFNLDTISGWNSLKGHSVGAVIGYKLIESKLQNMDAYFFRTYHLLFEMLYKNRIQVAVSTYIEALPVIMDLDVYSVVRHSSALERNEMYHYLHKKHADLVPVIDEVLRDMQKEGRLDEIVEELTLEYFTDSAD